jgi:hypothetical protein
MSKAALAFVFVVAACGGDDGTSQMMTPDASGSAAACTGAVYDVCTDNSQCESQNCHFYGTSNITVCTQACDASNPCPNDSAGNPVACNMKGNCKPSVANNCTL